MNRNTYLVLKKAVNLILLLAFFLTLTACEGKDTNDGKAANKEDTNQENTVQPEKEESDAADSKNNEVQSNALDEFKVYGKFAEFTTNDINGNEVTESIFANKDLTVVNIWGTFCGPCINEMPELGAWEKELPDNVQIVGLIVDISSTDNETQIAAAKQITEKADVGFVNLIGGNGDFDELIGSIVGVPTTIFVDKSGNIVGEIIVGADVDRYKSFVNRYVEALNNSSQKQAE
ncbi:MAG: TlpA family protein disulfide reductase [Lachnospiraceae bacterium]|nr:TlpA family protein disulfide reductase [Lachnospiraceae bacterium]